VGAFVWEIAMTDHPKTYGSQPVDLVKLGLNEIAYIRRAVIDNVPVWSIHAATGQPIGAAQSFDQAWGAVKQNDLVPQWVN